MRILFIITCLANIAFAFGSLPWMPNPDINHKGIPTRSTGFEHIVGAVLMSGIVGIVFAFMGGYVRENIVKMSNSSEPFRIPNSDYWLNEENRPKTIRRFRSFIESIGVGIMLLILLVQWTNFALAHGVWLKVDSVGMWLAEIVFYFFVAFCIIRFVHFRLSFRLPKE